MMTNWLGISNEAAPGQIPDSVKWSFYLGGAAFFAAVSWTVFTSKEYSPEELVGKHIIVVANLKPAKLRGVESQGMLLAADRGGVPIVATFEEEVEPGTRVR